MSYFRNFNSRSFFYSIQSFSDEKNRTNKFFVENLGKQVIEKVSNVNLSESRELLTLEIFI